MSRRSNLRLRPSLLGLESRDVPAVISPAALHAHAPQRNASIAAAAEAAAFFASQGGDPTNTSSTIAMLTPQGISRAVFVQSFSGSFGVGAPKFTDQLKQYLLIGNGGGTQMLHTRPDVMRLYTPATPGGLITGVAQINDKAVTNTGNELTFNLKALPGAVDKYGRPTHLIWQVSTAGGSYINAVGEGTVDIRYSTRGGKGSGAVGSHVSIFRGLVVSSGVSTVTGYNLNRI